VAISYSAGARRPASHSAQRLNTPHCDFRREPMPPSKTGNSSPFTEGKEEVICITTRTLQGVTFPAYLSLRKMVGVAGKKTSKYQLQEHKGLKL
jgi:hypothetical protein